MNDNAIKALQAIASLLVPVVAYLVYRSSKKTKAREDRMDAQERGQRSLEGALTRSDTERERLEERVDILERKVESERADCTRRLDLLVAQMEAAGLVPNPGAFR